MRRGEWRITDWILVDEDQSRERNRSSGREGECTASLLSGITMMLCPVSGSIGRSSVERVAENREGPPDLISAYCIPVVLS
jgi:hypothetical protein